MERERNTRLKMEGDEDTKRIQVQKTGGEEAVST
jgi:hypothetical protein